MLIVGALAVNLWWLARYRSGYPLDIDESRYLLFGLRLEDAVRALSPSEFWHAWSAQQSFGPLLPLTSVPFYLLFGQSIFVGLASQLVFLVVLTLSSYGIGSRLSGPLGGLVVAVVVATVPTVLDFARSYQFALTDAAMLAAATYALLACEAFSRRGWSLAWGGLLGLTVLARTMAVAFLPAQLIGAIWLIFIRPGARQSRWTNLGLGVLIGLLVAATWLATSFSSAFSYLANFGYGQQSGHFSSGSRSVLTISYWTREAGNAIKQDLYLPLAVGLVAAILATAGGRRIARFAPKFTALRGWLSGDAAIVLLVLLEAYVAISSSRNEGVGFRVPLVAPLIATVVAALSAVRWRQVRSVLVAALLVVAALNLITKSNLTGRSSSTVRLPALGSVPVISGTGYIQGYVLGSLEATSLTSTGSLAVSQKGWLPAYARIARGVLATSGSAPPVADLFTDEPLLNANDFTLAAELHGHRSLTVNLVPGPAAAASAVAYVDLLHAHPANALITVGRVGVSYFGAGGLHDVDQGALQHVATTLGFRCVSATDLPDGRAVLVLAPRPKGSALMPPGCYPRLTRLTPAPQAARVPRGTAIAAIFNTPIDVTSLARGFVLRDAATHAQVPGTASAFGETAPVFKPNQPLSPNTTYTATITGKASARVGTSATIQRSWTFRTGG